MGQPFEVLGIGNASNAVVVETPRDDWISIMIAWKAVMLFPLTYSSVAKVGTSSGRECSPWREQSTMVPSQTHCFGHLLSTMHWSACRVRNSSAPLHLNFSGCNWANRFRLFRLGSSHRASDVSSVGRLRKYSASQRKLQSQINGFRPRCLH